jgi:class 3 adenylate cyclase
MTVVFVDPVDSTALAEGRDSERVRAILQSYFSTTSSTVQAWGGTVEKYIGDAVVAVFGGPRIREDDPVRALSAALEIVDGVGELAADLARRSDVELRVPVRAASRPWLLAAALETYEALGARPHAARAQAALATVGAVDARSRTGPG